MTTTNGKSEYYNKDSEKGDALLTVKTNVG